LRAIERRTAGGSNAAGFVLRPDASSDPETVADFASPAYHRPMAMNTARLPWQDELAIIDRTMRAISTITDPDELVSAYWTGIDQLVPDNDFFAVSRRNVEPPYFLITRSSRWTEDINPWTQRHKLPRLSGGLVGEIAYANKPVIIEDLPARLSPSDPCYEYLAGYQILVALPQYDGGEGINVTLMLFPPGMELDRSIIPMLHWHAGLFGRGTTNLVLRNQLADALAALDRELQAVGEIQRSLLPTSLPEIPGVELAAYYNTSARAGGDYYDFFPLPGGRWGAFIADVSGHGTPAAVLMAITHALAHAQPGTHAPPSELLRYLNHQLTRSYAHNGTFVTAFYAVIDPAARTLTYARAGHNPPRLLRGGEVLSLNGRGALPMGIDENLTFQQTSIDIQSGDLLLLYTDGITEAMAPMTRDDVRQLFGVERLDELLRSCGSASPADCIERIREALAGFVRNAPVSDDRTLLAMRFQES
jgi:sigma-B regulation protein RsbU (phosphoserine phosphatase)